jgi:hypothetical protein
MATFITEESWIDVTPEAAAQVRSKGGRLFLWQTPVGEWLEDHADFRCPEDIGFDTIDVEGIQVLIASDIALPESIVIERSRFGSRLKLRILWDWKVWGRRGREG